MCLGLLNVLVRLVAYFRKEACLISAPDLEEFKVNYLIDLVVTRFLMIAWHQHCVEISVFVVTSAPFARRNLKESG